MSTEEVDQESMIERPASDHEDAQVSRNYSPEDSTDQPAEVDQGSNREAAKYRRRLRQAEAERDQLAAQLATARRAVVETALDRLPVKVHPDLIWMRSSPADYFNESGELNQERLELIVENLRQLGAAQVKGWHSGEGREPRRPGGRSARDRAVKVIMGRTEE